MPRAGRGAADPGRRGGSAVPDGLPADAVVFEAPDDDPDGVFADLVGSFAAALDDGVEPGDGVPRVGRLGRLDARSRTTEPARRSADVEQDRFGGRQHQRLDELRPVAPDVVDEPLDGVDLEVDVLVRHEQPEQLRRIRRRGSSQRSQASSEMTTGIRSWRSASASLGVVVTIVKVRRTVSVSGSRQPAHRPARASGRPSRRTTRYGWRTLPSRFHS